MHLPPSIPPWSFSVVIQTCEFFLLTSPFMSHPMRRKEIRMKCQVRIWKGPSCCVAQRLQVCFSRNPVRQLCLNCQQSTWELYVLNFLPFTHKVKIRSQFFRFHTGQNIGILFPLAWYAPALWGLKGLNNVVSRYCGERTKHPSLHYQRYVEFFYLYLYERYLMP